MAQTNPNLPAQSQSHVILPPNYNAPFIDRNSFNLTTYSLQFLQQLYAAVIANDSSISSINSSIASINAQILLTGSTWTPTLTFGGASVGLTYTTQVGLYNRVGNLIAASFDILLSAQGASVGDAVISGLETIGPLTAGIGVLQLYAYSNMAAGPFVGFFNDSDLSLRLLINGAANTAIANDTNFTNTSHLTGAIIYIAT